jgi:hypothetical protein
MTQKQRMDLGGARSCLDEAYLDGWWSNETGDDPQFYASRAMQRAQKRGDADWKNEHKPKDK